MDWWLLAFVQIILINIILSGDNAIVIAMASRKLPEAKQRLAIFWGAFGAVILRVLLTIVAIQLLQIPYLMGIGAVLLVWIAIKLLVEKEEETKVHPGNQLGTVVMTIVMADFVMSLDNVIAITAIAQGDFILIALGLAVSIPMIVWGSGLILKLLDMFPVFLYAGAALLGFTAGEMLMGDRHVAEIVLHIFDFPEKMISVTIALLVVGCGWSWKRVKAV